MAEETKVQEIGDAIVCEVARQSKSALGNTGHNDYCDLMIGGLDSEGDIITLDRVALAKVALDALREPTEAMILAGVHHDNMGDMAGRWRAMIDAALSQIESN